MPSQKSPSSQKPVAAGARNADAAAVEAELSSFIDKFTPELPSLIRDCRREVRTLLPTAIELVYDNYNFFVIGYSSTERPSDCIVSLAAAANGVGLSFYRGASVPDPDGLLQGEGKQNRFIRLPAVSILRAEGVRRLVRSAAAMGKTPVPATGTGRTIIRSVSATQRPRRRDAK